MSKKPIRLTFMIMFVVCVVKKKFVEKRMDNFKPNKMARVDWVNKKRAATSKKWRKRIKGVYIFSKYIHMLNRKTHHYAIFHSNHHCRRHRGRPTSLSNHFMRIVNTHKHILTEGDTIWGVCEWWKTLDNISWNELHITFYIYYI